MVVSLHQNYKCKTMAKGNAISGKIRGKLGSQVYRIENGEQIISEYNPSKQDRNSDKQIIQRSKIALVNQISRQFDWVDLVGLSTNRKTARNAFVGNMVHHTTAVITSPEQATATADLSALKLSRGAFVNTDSTNIDNVSERGSVVNSRITFPEDTEVKRYLLYVLPVRDVPNPIMGAFLDSVKGVSVEVVGGTACRAQAVINASTVITGITGYAYAVPVIPNTLKKRVIYDKLLSTAVANTITAETQIELARADMFGDTIFLGSVHWV